MSNSEMLESWWAALEVSSGITEKVEIIPLKIHTPEDAAREATLYFYDNPEGMEVLFENNGEDNAFLIFKGNKEWRVKVNTSLAINTEVESVEEITKEG